MELSDFVDLGFKNYGQGEILEIYWHSPNRDSPPLMINRAVRLHGYVGLGLPLDDSNGERGFLLCYYTRLVRELPEEYKEGNVKPPFIEVCPTKERNGCPNNTIQIPLSYISRIIQLGKKT